MARARYDAMLLAAANSVIFYDKDRQRIIQANPTLREFETAYDASEYCEVLSDRHATAISRRLGIILPVKRGFYKYDHKGSWKQVN